MAYALDEAHAGARVTLPTLFVTFLKVSLFGFGGPIVWARRFIVEQQHWLTDQDFADLLSLCQFLPGPNVASITVCLGSRLRGPAGALTALAGFILIPWSIGFALGALSASAATGANAGAERRKRACRSDAGGGLGRVRTAR